MSPNDFPENQLTIFHSVFKQ